MKKSIILIGATVLMGCFVSCGGQKATESPAEEANVVEVPEYKLMENMPDVDIATYKKDGDGKINLFDGKTLAGWRGYTREDVPANWNVDNGTLHLIKRADNEAGGGDLLFAHKFKNFELEWEWKGAKGANSGLMILVQEVEKQPSYISAPEYQLYDNLETDAIHQTAALYDMIPAQSQAYKLGEWNKCKIVCNKGTITHYLNDVQVVTYQMWTEEWREMVNKSKFGQEKWPLAYALMSECGGKNHEGYITLQDHGDEIWFRNIYLKELAD